MKVMNVLLYSSMFENLHVLLCGRQQSTCKCPNYLITFT